MKFELYSGTYGPIQFQSNVPPPLSKFVVPGSFVFYAEGSFGFILLQEIKVGRISLWYNSYSVIQDVALDFRFDQPVLQAHVCVRNNAQYEIEEIGWVELKQGQCNIVYLAAGKGTTYLERGYEYRTFDICFSIEYIRELIHLFPQVADFISKVRQNIPAVLFPNHPWVNTSMLEIIDQLLNCTFDGELRNYYFVHKAEEFLLLVLTQAPADAGIDSGLSRSATESVYQARYIIETRFSEHLVLQDIAKYVGLNETKLKTGFKQIFGVGIFEHLLKTRMRVAKTLLLESDKPIKAIAKLTGYATRQGFITAFKNYYDDTPSSFRRNM